MLTAIRRDGTGAEPLIQSYSSALMAWWAGQADPLQKTTVRAFLVSLHQRSMWLSCNCIGSAVGHTARPLLAPVKKDDTVFLRRMPNRPAHANNCAFWYDQVEMQKIEPPPDCVLVGVHGETPSFILDDPDELVLSEAAGVKEHPHETTTGKTRLPRHAARLFWLAQASGFQRVPSFINPVRELLKTAENVEVGPGLSLKSLLYCNTRAWSEAWYWKAFLQCSEAAIAPSCWLIQLAIGIDLKTRTITYKDEIGKLLQVAVNGEMKVFGGDTSAARFPLLVIALIRKSGAGAVVDSAYAHPVLNDNRWMLVDSDLERKTYRDLVQICVWLKDEKGLEIEIEKPLYAWIATNERPDFVLTWKSKSGKRHHFIVKTIGFDDPLYQVRKTTLAANVRCPVFFDNRFELADSCNMNLAAAVAFWAAQLSLV